MHEQSLAQQKGKGPSSAGIPREGDTLGRRTELGITRHPSGFVAFSVHEKCPFLGLRKKMKGNKGNEISGRDSNIMGQNANARSY